MKRVRKMKRIQFLLAPMIVIGVFWGGATALHGNGKKTLSSGSSHTLIVGESNSLWAWGGKPVRTDRNRQYDQSAGASSHHSGSGLELCQRCRKSLAGHQNRRFPLGLG